MSQDGKQILFQVTEQKIRNQETEVNKANIW